MGGNETQGALGHMGTCYCQRGRRIMESGLLVVNTCPGCDDRVSSQLELTKARKQVARADAECRILRDEVETRRVHAKLLEHAQKVEKERDKLKERAQKTEKAWHDYKGYMEKLLVPRTVGASGVCAACLELVKHRVRGPIRGPVTDGNLMIECCICGVAFVTA